jgi:FkbM family methyltransferase
MEKKLRSLLHQSLGTEKYLSLVSRIYIGLIKAGFLKRKYPELFFLKQLIKPGDVCIDLGANVGYYSTMMAPLCGPNGHVHAVEPVQLFQTIFTQNSKRFHCANVTLHAVALGAREGTITRGTPIIEGVFRHGLTHVIEPGEDTSNMQTYSVVMRTPDQLFANLSRLDFLKCDVEGYEVILLPHFVNILTKFKPLIQIEVSTVENRTIIIELLAAIGYKPYGLIDGSLQKLSNAEHYEQGDFYFKIDG